MHRRNILAVVGAMLPAAFAVSRAGAATATGAKAAYHLADLEKVEFVLHNITSHYRGMGGPENVTIALMVHGPALKGFHLAEASPAVTQLLADLSKAGLQFSACINTMRATNVTLTDLLPGFTVADKGGVVRLAELQAQGYAYLRP